MALTLEVTDERLSELLRTVWEDETVDIGEYLDVMRESDKFAQSIEANLAVREVQKQADNLVAAFRTLVRQTNANDGKVQSLIDDTSASTSSVLKKKRTDVALAVEWQVAYVVVAVEALRRKLVD
jgi:hypothetical protein